MRRSAAALGFPETLVGGSAPSSSLLLPGERRLPSSPPRAMVGANSQAGVGERGFRVKTACDRRRQPSSLCQVVTLRQDDRLELAMNSQLAEDVLNVITHRRSAEGEPFRHRLRGEAGGQELQDFFFANREPPGGLGDLFLGRRLVPKSLSQVRLDSTSLGDVAKRMDDRPGLPLLI